MNPSGKHTHADEQSPHVLPHVHHATVMDVSEQRVARVYAESLLNAAGASAGEVLDQLDAIFAISQTDPRLYVFFSAAVISRELKAKSFREALTGRANPIVLNFLLALNDHDRLELLRGIVKEAHELFNQRAGRMYVLVLSAVALPDEQRERLLHELRGKFQREPVLDAQVDPELIGGMVVRVGDWVMDDSVRTRLQTLRKEIIEKSSHEIQTGRNRFSAD